jgi:hypothetical protein
MCKITVPTLDGDSVVAVASSLVKQSTDINHVITATPEIVN